MIAQEQDESFFCQYCETCIGHGLIIGAIIHRHEPICIHCRWDMINTYIIEYNLSISSNFQKNIELLKEYGPEQKKKSKEIYQQIQIINALDQAVANWSGQT